METNVVLLVDDDKEFRRAMKKMFEKSGYRITIACDGQEALDALSEEEFDLIISDLRMPNLDGLEMMAELRRRGLDGSPGGQARPSGTGVGEADRSGRGRLAAGRRRPNHRVGDHAPHGRQHRVL